MKINEEVDALEVMAVHPLRYLVTARLLGVGIAVIPLYMIGLLGSYLASKWAVVYLFGQSPGQYDHYFNIFIRGHDVFLSVVKMVVFSIMIVLIHCWYGIRVQGGPQSVGEATGRAIRASIVVNVVLDMILTLVFWGSDSGFRVSG